MSTVIPENISRLMSPADRKSIGVGAMTASECREKAEVKDERELQKLVRGYLGTLDIWHDTDAMHKGRTGTVGCPDFTFPFRGKLGYCCYVAWECKPPWAARLRPEQVIARDAIINQGGQWRLITTLFEAQSHLRELDATPSQNYP